MCGNHYFLNYPVNRQTDRQTIGAENSTPPTSSGGCKGFCYDVLVWNV